MLVSWVLFPALLAGLALGIGLLVERLTGTRVPGALLAPMGLAGLVVAGHAATALDATAELAPWAALALALAGFALSPPWRRGRLDRTAALACGGAFAVFGAPVLLSGEATFAGYIKLDDTATWMALTDRVMEHGRSLDGLAPSTYEATLDFNLDEGYPVGAFVPLGIGAALTGTDVAWLVQPYIALWGAMLALALAALARSVGLGGWSRGAVAFLGAQPALLYGYSLWGGIKEVAAAALVAALAALIPLAFARDAGPRRSLPAAVGLAALAAVLSPGGLVWAVPLLALAALIAWRARGAARTLRQAARLVGATAALSVPLLGASAVPPTSSPLTAGDARGNLLEPLEPAQVAGIWPAGDFRFSPELAELAYVLVFVVAAAGLVGLVLAWERGDSARALAGYGCGTLLAAALLAAFGSPWAEAKAYAIASPAALFLGLVGAAMLLSRRAPSPAISHARWLGLAGTLALAVIGAGVIWSNALAYGGANLAPRDQLAELEAIGERFAGQGPALLTEYQPYGARHFLRKLDAEAASELRRRRVPLADGGVLKKGLSADTDEFAWAGLEPYRTLVLRRSPSRSRPPSPYEPVWRGHWYEVWGRDAGAGVEVAERLGLGDAVSPVGSVGRCADVRALAGSAGARGELRFTRGPAPLRVRLGHARRPESWAEDDTGAGLFPVGEGTASVPVTLPRRGSWELWLRGSVRGEMTVAVDGEPLETARQMLNNEGQYMRLGSLELGRGQHRIELRYGGPDLQPGSAGPPVAVGPLVLSTKASSLSAVHSIPDHRYRELCGLRLDWVEAVLPGQQPDL
jgi:hypothetical protein